MKYNAVTKCKPKNKKGLQKQGKKIVLLWLIKKVYILLGMYCDYTMRIFSKNTKLL